MIIGIVGAGAAGLMAAATIQEFHPEAAVLLFEKNKVLGRKVSISGGERCNVTTGIRDVKELLTKYPRGHKFLTSAMYHFGPDKVYQWFEDHGVPLYTQDDRRVFPQSDVGTDIVAVFEKLFNNSTVKVVSEVSIDQISQLPSQQFKLQTKAGTSYTVDKLILTTGGQARRYTGSTGDGYIFAETLGHHITPLAASLNSFIVKDDWMKSLAGVSFTAVGLSVAGQRQYQFTGPIVFTHQGLSGPAVFALSSQVAFEHYTQEQPLALLVDFLPTLSMEQLRHELNQLITHYPKQQLSTTLHAWLPKSVVASLLHELHLPADKTNAEVSNVMRQRILDHLKKCPVTVIGRGSGDEFVTAGGVELSEVDPRTMQSKLCPGLAFAGEILNMDGYTGGFNLQAAWATGRLAGEYIISN